MALIVLGPERMPDVIRMLVQIVREVRTAANEAIREITEAMEEDNPSLRGQSRSTPSLDSVPAPPELPAPIEQQNPSNQDQPEPPPAAAPGPVPSNTGEAATGEHTSGQDQQQHSSGPAELQPEHDEARQTVEKA